MKRHRAALLALALLVPVSVATTATADHERAIGEEICPQDAIDNIWPDNPIPDIDDCRDNEFTAPGAHAKIQRLELTTISCTEEPVLCEIEVDAETEHWAWRPRSTGELRVRAVGPTGTTMGFDECETGGQFRGTCTTRVTFEHLAPTEEIEEAEVTYDPSPQAGATVSPGAFCVQAFAKTTPHGATGLENDEQDEDPARDMAGTCVEVDQHWYNGLP